MNSGKTFYVTTPIYYVNDRPHIGTAYTTIAADVLARFHRSAGYETWFLTGLDEHGQKIAKAAEQMGLSPGVFVDKMAEPFIDIWKLLNISNDDFIRTTQERHEKAVRLLWERSAKNGDIYLGKYEGLYCYGCEAYFTEKDLDSKGECPLGHGKPNMVSMPSYFFRLSKYTDKLLEFYENNPDFVKPKSRANEVISFVREGLKDISISRTNFSWGIPVPGDPQHVIYVWFDALTNYISALGWGSKDDSLFQKFWPADYHLVGKDILRFHAVYWPAMLMSAGLEPPKCVYAHGFLTIGRQKMSKTLRNVVDPLLLKWEFGIDATRYYLMRDNVFGLDGDFNHDALMGRINSDLANDLGNLFSRSVTLVHKFAGGKVPECGDGGEEEKRLRETALKASADASLYYHEAAFSSALETIWNFCYDANRYIDVKKPWAVAKAGGKRELSITIYHCLESCRFLAHMIAPVMPLKAREMLYMLGYERLDMNAEPAWPHKWGEIPEGMEVRQSRILFPKIAEEAGASIKQRLGLQNVNEAQKGEEKVVKVGEALTGHEPRHEAEKYVTVDEFKKVQIIVAEIKECQRIAGTDKLLKLVVDTGNHEMRTIVAGIGASYDPTGLIGKKIILIKNLKPAKIKGIFSEGMLLAAEGDGKVVLLTVDGDVPAGANVR